MGDHFEIQITPENPGRHSIRNPFESPNDYHRLHEPLMPSPSVFKSKSSSSITTPAKFKWSIEDMSSLLPVHIDQEDIQRQSLYLSQSRTDSDIEEKCQNAIDQFFTKEAIVPSPWAAPSSGKNTQSHKKSPLSPLIIEESQKLSVACQTTLSLPVTFDLEKILGEYYRCEEMFEAVQESLSSSSLRRKLFLDGADNYIGSDNSNPSSPERGLDKDMGVVDGVKRCHSEPLLSPMSCGMAARTPSTGNFSSSPIQGRIHDYSLGSIASPLFPDRSSPARFTSPTLSPIGPQSTLTPIGSGVNKGERKQLTFLTPDGISAPLDMDVNSCTESPYVEGCSPIRSCSPQQQQLHMHTAQPHKARPRPRVRCWASPPLISPIPNPKLQDGQETEQQLPAMELGSSFPWALPKPPGEPRSERPCEGGDRGFPEPVKMEQGKEVGTGGRLEDIVEGEEDETGGELSGLLTSSRVGNASAADMFASMLTEQSSTRNENSMQVDSGYNTTSAGTASLFDGFNSDCHGKESFSSNVAFKGLYPYH